MKSRISLVTGGARSGKSIFAEKLLAACAGKKAYVATAQVLDEEMTRRITWHRNRRPDSWVTVEVPYQLAEKLDEIMGNADAILVDCLTLYFSNYLFQHLDIDFNELVDGAMTELDAVIEVIGRHPGTTIIFVTNELGSGIVPMEKISRDYRDLMGLVNQRMGEEADNVYLTVCGIATEIKSQQIELPDVGEQES